METSVRTVNTPSLASSSQPRSHSAESRSKLGQYIAFSVCLIIILCAIVVDVSCRFQIFTGSIAGIF